MIYLIYFLQDPAAFQKPRIPFINHNIPLDNDLLRQYFGFVCGGMGGGGREVVTEPVGFSLL